MRRMITGRIAVAGLLGAVLVGCGAENGTNSTEPGKPGPGVRVVEVRASEFEKALASHRGKVVVVDCWATWCGPCVKKFPHLVEMHKKYAEKGLVCVSMSMDKDGAYAKTYEKEKVLKFLQNKEATFPNFIMADPKEDEKEFIRILAGDFYIIPYMVVFDRDGKKVWNSTEEPELDDEQLEKLIEQELAKKPAK